MGASAWHGLGRPGHGLSLPDHGLGPPGYGLGSLEHGFGPPGDGLTPPEQGLGLQALVWPHTHAKIHRIVQDSG